LHTRPLQKNNGSITIFQYNDTVEVSLFQEKKSQLFFLVLSGVHGFGCGNRRICNKAANAPSLSFGRTVYELSLLFREIDENLP